MEIYRSGVVLVLMIGVGAFLLGRGTSDKADVIDLASTTPTVFTSPTDTSPVQDDWLTYDFVGFKATREGWIWRPFALRYPSSWSVALENKDESSQSFNLTMKRTDGSYFTILQGFGEGGRCLFPQDPDYESFDGMGVHVTTYEEIQKNADKWRLAKVKTPNDISTHVSCGINPNRGSEYSSGWNVVGINEIKLTSDVAYQEFMEMLKQIEIK